MRFLSLAIAVVLASPAMAQQTTPPPPLAPPTFVPQPTLLFSQDQLQRRDLEFRNTPRSLAAQTQRVRMQRAETAADMINAGQCQEAYRFAVGADDTPLANRILAVCRGED